MVTITGGDTYFTSIDATFGATKWEACIDQFIDLVNGYAGDDVIPNMTGTAGSKELSVTSGQAGFIRRGAIAVYASTKNAGATSTSFGLGAISESSSSSVGGENDSPDELAMQAAQRLKEIEVSYG
jgi:hypothetical protein